MNMKLWSICNDLDTVATNQEAAQDAHPGWIRPFCLRGRQRRSGGVYGVPAQVPELFPDAVSDPWRDAGSE